MKTLVCRLCYTVHDKKTKSRQCCAADDTIEELTTKEVINRMTDEMNDLTDKWSKTSELALQTGKSQGLDTALEVLWDMECQYAQEGEVKKADAVRLAHDKLQDEQKKLNQ